MKIDFIQVEVIGDLDKPKYVMVSFIEGKKYKTISFIPSEVELPTKNLGYIYKGHNVPKK